MTRDEREAFSGAVSNCSVEGGRPEIWLVFSRVLSNPRCGGKERMG